jgi:hypothetical protein
MVDFSDHPVLMLPLNIPDEFTPLNRRMETDIPA